MDRDESTNDGDGGWEFPSEDDGPDDEGPNGDVMEGNGPNDDDEDRDLRTIVAIVFGISFGLGLAAFAVGVVGMLIVGSILIVAGVPLLEMPALEVLLSTVMLQGIGFGSVAVIYLAYRNWPSHLVPLRIPTIKDVLWIVGGVAMLFIASIGIQLGFALFGIESAEHGFVAFENPEVFLLLIPLQFLLVGPAEELLFRGIIQGWFREHIGPVGAISLTSVLFAVFHFTAYLSPVLSEILAALSLMLALSVVLGVIYELTENLVVPAIVHGAFNAIQFGALYLVESGMLPEEAATAAVGWFTPALVGWLPM